MDGERSYAEQVRRNIKNNLVLLRRYNGLSRNQLAEKVSVSTSYIAALENPRLIKSPSLEVLANIAKTLDSSVGKMSDTNTPDSLMGDYVRDNLLNKKED